MHPILANRERFLLYLGTWLPGSGLLALLVATFTGMPWHQAAALAVPMALVYAFVCLASWYPCQTMPISEGQILQPIAAHSLAALISSSLWLVAGLGWSILLDRSNLYDDTLDRFREMLVLFIVAGILLYVLAVAVHYLLIAFEASRRTEADNLQLRVQTQEAELRAVQAQREQELAEQELELARSIQRRLLPPSVLGGDGFRVAARNTPARFVAGDFYDVFRLESGKIGLVVADVAGKGIGASLITASVKAMTPLIADRHSVTDTLQQLNRKLCSELAPREFVALSIALFDISTGELEIANSGLPDPYLMAVGGGARTIEVPGSRLPLGIREDVVYESLTLQLGQGERLLLLTDGLPEARKPDGEPLGYESLADLLAVPQTELEHEPGAWLDGLFTRVRDASEQVPRDDLTALLLERAGSRPALA
jgi:serine phosphatase RsbU (regulator of sigma subunit)